MTSRRRVSWTSRVLPLAVPLLVVPFLGAPALADPTDPADPAAPPAASSPQEIAEEALETVEEIIEASPPAAGGAFSGGAPAHGGKDLTLALRDLAVSRSALPKSKRAEAARLLARPTDPLSTCQNQEGGDLVCYRPRSANKRCNSLLCVHWVTSGRHAIPGENDGPGGRYPGKRGGLPDYVELTLATMTYVAQRYVGAGYRPVLSDSGAGGTAQPDVYLGEIGALGFYGYCAVDSWPDSTQHVAAPGYCVLDNDYAEFGIAPRVALRVTAAHEWFHAVQFAYDVNEDAWLMEATATWAEDELYDGINDNRNYLPLGPLAQPQRPLDAADGQAPYGTWIFFRFLSERYPGSVGGMPTVVRDIWRRLAHDGEGGAASMYSVQAVRSALAARRTSLATQLAWFTVWNRRPAIFYEEGRAYRASPTARTYRLRPASPSAAARFRLDHLAARTYRFEKRAGTRGAWNLRLKLNLNDAVVGSRAVITVKRRGQPARSRLIALNASGNRASVYAFGSQVQWIDVTALNTSTRYRGCGDPDRDAYMTCQGFALDDGRPQVISGRLSRR